MWTKKSGGKSQLHASIQLYLQNLLRNSKIEVAFPSIGRVADLVWEPGLIFEVQCSPLSFEKMCARSRDYASLGYRVVWILHVQAFGKQLQRWHLAPLPHYFTDLNCELKGSLFDCDVKMSIFRSIELAFPMIYTPQQIRRLPAAWKRRALQWGVGFKGDLVDCALQNRPKIGHAFVLSLLTTHRHWLDRLQAQLWR